MDFKGLHLILRKENIVGESMDYDVVPPSRVGDEQRQQRVWPIVCVRVL